MLFSFTDARDHFGCVFAKKKSFKHYLARLKNKLNLSDLWRKKEKILKFYF